MAHSPKRIHLLNVRGSGVSTQDSSIECLETCVTRLNSISDVRNIARTYFEREFSWFDPRAPLIVTGMFSEVRVFYVCTKTSGSHQLSFVDCRFHFDSRQMWIGSLQVAACYRLRGVGRQLVRAAEATANALGMEEVRILPRPSSIDFWLKLEYASDSRSARVLWKNPANVAESQTSRSSSWLYMSSSSGETV
jgi:N-acetylglutamate synthase-like GNAT family acetyltransferase